MFIVRLNILEIVVSWLSSLFPGKKSRLLQETLALFVILPLALVLTFTVIVIISDSDSPTAKLEYVHQ